MVIECMPKLGATDSVDPIVERRLAFSRGLIRVVCHKCIHACLYGSHIYISCSNVIKDRLYRCYCDDCHEYHDYALLELPLAPGLHLGEGTLASSALVAPRALEGTKGALGPRHVDPSIYIYICT